jgi:hypothetical protein
MRNIITNLVIITSRYFLILIINRILYIIFAGRHLLNGHVEKCPLCNTDENLCERFEDDKCVVITLRGLFRDIYICYCHIILTKILTHN